MFKIDKAKKKVLKIEMLLSFNVSRYGNWPSFHSFFFFFISIAGAEIHFLSRTVDYQQEISLVKRYIFAQVVPVTQGESVFPRLCLASLSGETFAK